VKPEVLVIGGEPAALSCAARLLHEGARVTHLFPSPWGLLGASRDIGLAYPELGEPYERLAYALGEELAREMHAWGKQGIELLTSAAEDCLGFRRGSRLSLTRHEQEAALVGTDALERQRLGDEVRLMSGGAASNYAPLATTVHQACFETHAAAFPPVAVCERLQRLLAAHHSYQAMELNVATGWRDCRVEGCPGGVRAFWGASSVEADLAVVAAACESARLLQKFSRALVPLLGQAFASEPLRERARSSVVGITTSWGGERYRFDPDQRLLGCGIDPGAGDRHSEAMVLETKQAGVWRRACEIFSDLAQSGDEVQRWGVLFTTTCDGLPLLGPLPGEPRIHLAAGFSTSAWSRGYAAGEVLGRMLSGVGEVSPLVQRCSPRRLV
jgi:glycine/D-amino acid oxidase-like deaminating enzyme